MTGPKRHVLVIDDELEEEPGEVNSRIEALKAAGFHITLITRVGDLSDALDRTKEGIECVVLDIMMPPDDYVSMEESEGGRLTGIAIYHDLRRRFGPVPVIVVSAHSSEALAPLLPGVRRILERPISDRILVAELREALGHGRDAS